jgi:GNAT superfamily N-acetyltransferase
MPNRLPDQPASILEIRQALQEDAGTLAALMHEMDEPDASSEAPLDDARQMRDILDEMAAWPSFRAYIAHLNGEPVGSFSLLVFSSPTHGGAPQAILDAVVIRREWRGAGIGQAMVAQANLLARAAGCYKISLSSNLKRVEAHHVYEKLGFRQHGFSYSLVF